MTFKQGSDFWITKFLCSSLFYGMVVDCTFKIAKKIMKVGFGVTANNQAAV